MTETNWNLPTPDGHTIYGVKDSPATGKANAAIFIVHGLTGHMYEYQHKRAADYFSGQGFDVYRFYLYSDQKGARQLVDCTIATHASDLNTVLNAFAGEYEKTFAIGHSYGGPTVMMAAPKILTSASLWDPTFNPKHKALFTDKYIQSGYYAVDWGVVSLIGKAMNEERQTLDEAACIALAENFGHPVQVIHAGNGTYVKDSISYHSFGHPQNRREVVEGTEHCFHEGNTCDDLLNKTHNWFKEWL